MTEAQAIRILASIDALDMAAAQIASHAAEIDDDEGDELHTICSIIEAASELLTRRMKRYEPKP